MPTFDFVSETDKQEIKNAVDQANRELESRFDFRGVGANIEYLEKDKKIVLSVPSMNEAKLEDMEDILRNKLIKRKIDTRILDKQTLDKGNHSKQAFKLKEGIDQETAKKIVKYIKDKHDKVKCSIQKDQVRVEGKKRDDLQDVIAGARTQDFGVQLQVQNLRD
ncbi:MAG: YajQ family cyclic di-GMP-binding protein [Gammaproteobacteria bacterium]|nr:YajQ family cyclic di-GMP-binding protein [Gammaproteobacteria bacterium]